MVPKFCIERLNAALRKTQSIYKTRISHNDQLFLQRIYGEGLGKYIDRLDSIGFRGLENVLDAGCGYGQWSLALAEMNRSVSSCDISDLRVDFLRDLSKELNFQNIDYQVNGINELPYSDDSFDAIFCFGVIFLTPWRRSLVEMARVLKPGGKLYVNANGLGWYIFLWQEEHNKADDYDPKATAAQAFNNTLSYDRDGYYKSGMNLIIEPEAMEFELRQLGFQKILRDQEGCLHLNKEKSAPKPFFFGEYKCSIGVYEIIAEKKKE